MPRIEGAVVGVAVVVNTGTHTAGNGLWAVQRRLQDAEVDVAEEIRFVLYRHIHEVARNEGAELVGARTYTRDGLHGSHEIIHDVHRGGIARGCHVHGHTEGALVAILGDGVGCLRWRAIQQELHGGHHATRLSGAGRIDGPVRE